MAFHPYIDIFEPHGTPFEHNYLEKCADEEAWSLWNRLRKAP